MIVEEPTSPDDSILINVEIESTQKIRTHSKVLNWIGRCVNWLPPYSKIIPPELTCRMYCDSLDESVLPYVFFFYATMLALGTTGACFFSTNPSKEPCTVFYICSVIDGLILTFGAARLIIRIKRKCQATETISI